ncbi:nitric oxide-associated protein 1 [Drosophila tropicalis]|uniref:nitric oxide-associated protein 1 n=1 Tax=Drosophila tropicalis TaxID=46794 RepID=UPI0035AC1D29
MLRVLGPKRPAFLVGSKVDILQLETNSRLCKYLQRTVRRHNTEAHEQFSSRQRAWQVARERYKNYEHIHYSSVVETGLIPKKPASSASSRFSLPNPNWLEDYEFYAGNARSLDGSEDKSIASSSVPCSGCGAHLHCHNSSYPGYIPSEIFKGRTETELRTIICKRCHFLKHYNLAIDVEVPSSSYVDTISRIQDKFALAIVLVDLLDFPSSIWPGMLRVLGSKRPVFLVGNKVDLLPRDSNSYMNHVRSCLAQEFIKHGGGQGMNIKHVSLISAKTGYGIEELITQLHNIWAYKGDVYLLGCTNVGKSTLFNILLNSDYCRPEASDLVPRATTCPWPGTTLKLLRFPILRPSDLRIYQRFKRLFSERGQRAAMEKLRRDQAKESKGDTSAAQPMALVGRTFDRRNVVNDVFAMSSGIKPVTTLNERRAEYREARWVYDTPGVMQPDQLTPLLTTEELSLLQPRKMIRPRAFRMRPNMSLMLGGLARFDLLDCLSDERQLEYLKVIVFASEQIPLLIVDTEHAETVYQRYLGTELLGLPISGHDAGDAERIKRWPGLQCRETDIVITNSERNIGKLSCDITLSSAGWIGLLMPLNSECHLRAWTPLAAGVYVRKPALVPLADRLVGKHIRYSLAYNTSKPFVFQK